MLNRISAIVVKILIWTTLIRFGVAVSMAAAPSQGVYKRYALTGSPGAAAVAYGFGDIWFTEPESNRVGVLRFDGSIREFEVPTPNAGIVGFTVTFAPSGVYVWFTESTSNQIGRVNPDGSISEFPVPTPSSLPWGIAGDLGGVAFFTERASNAIGRIDSNGTITEYRIPTPGTSPTAIAIVGVDLGFDVWIASSARNSIGRLRAPRYDFLEETSLPNPASEPFAIVPFLGSMWFTERSGDRIGRIDQDGALTEFALAAGSHPSSLDAYLAGGEFLWFTEPGANRIATINQDAQVTEYALPAGVSGPSGIATNGIEAWFGTLTPTSLVRTRPDEHLFVGTGASGPWQSDVVLASTESSDRTVFLGAYPDPPGVCPGSCFGFTTADLPGASGVAVPGPFLGNFVGSGGLNTVFERPLGTGRLTAAHFRFTNTARPTQSADGPVAALSAVTALDPALLAFPSASSSPTSKSNLFLSNVGQDGPLTARVEAFAADGTPLSTSEVSLDLYAETILANVVGAATPVSNAQVRVTKTSGDGLLWGMLATVSDEDGTLSISSGSNFAAADDDMVLIGGGGVAGTWDTVLDLANPVDADIFGELRKRGGVLPEPCPPACLDETYRVVPNGTARVLASSFLSGEWTGTRLLATTGPAVVHARVVNRANPIQAADLPTIALSRLQAANPDVLVFPSARRGDDVRTNLFLAGIGDGDPVRARVEVLSADGAVLASSETDVMSWNGPGSTFFVDLLAQLDVEALPLGQVRVTRVGGTQLLWGVLSNVYADGRLSVVAPAFP